jgi:hypothetical protein
VTEANDALLEMGGMQRRASLLEVSQASLALPSDRGRIKMKTLKW